MSTLAHSTVLVSYPPASQAEIAVEFSESGWRVLRDTRTSDSEYAGWLHIEAGRSAEAITPACRDQIIRYYFSHPLTLPGIGATPQQQYWPDMPVEQFERIGNQGRIGYYA